MLRFTYHLRKYVPMWQQCERGRAAMVCCWLVKPLHINIQTDKPRKCKLGTLSLLALPNRGGENDPIILKWHFSIPEDSGTHTTAHLIVSA